MSMDPDRFLMGAPKVPSWKFVNPGDRILGEVVFREVRQQIDYLTKEPKVWKSGDPMYQLVVHVQTQLRDPSIENDQGLRAVYVKGRQMEAVIRDAVRAAGAPGIQVGGQLSLTYIGPDMTSEAPIKPHAFQAAYRAAPVAGVMPGQPQTFGYGPSVVQALPDPWAQPAQAYPQARPQQPAHATGGTIAGPQSYYPQHEPAGQPAHHEQGPPPEWATAAPTSPAAPAPAMNTLAAIKAAQLAGQPVSGQPNVDYPPPF